MNHIGIDVPELGFQEHMIHKTASVPSTRLDTSILCPDRLTKTSISCPDNQSVSSEDTISDSEFGAIDRRELLAAKQLRRLRYSNDCVPSKRRRTIAHETLPLPMPFPLETHANKHWVAPTVNSTLNQPLSSLSPPGSLPEIGDGVQSPSLDLSIVLEMESRRKLKELHEIKFPVFMRSLEEMSEQLFQSQQAMKPLRSFISESNECLAEMRIQKYCPTMQL